MLLHCKQHLSQLTTCDGSSETDLYQVHKELDCGLIWFVQVITLEGWVEIMYYVMDAHSFYNFIYFIFLIIVSFYTLPCMCSEMKHVS